MSAKFWPYAFHHLLRLRNAIQSRDKSSSPTQLAHGHPDDFSPCALLVVVSGSVALVADAASSPLLPKRDASWVLCRVL
jgi:hypothetical protein